VKLRQATLEDAEEIAAIYAPIVQSTFISFESEPPSAAEMRARIAKSLERHCWLASEDEHGRVNGYVYASAFRDRAAYRWSVETTAYVRDDSRGLGIGKCLYLTLLPRLLELGYYQVFAGIALPNPASVALHEAVGFKPIGTYRNVGFKLGAWHDVGWWQLALREATPPPAQ
jgi:L-amino acid N-acyltransferase YncA